MVQTVFHGTPVTRPIAKPFAWSYSRLKNWRACPLKHYMIDLAKAVKEEKSAALEGGTYAHDEIAKYIRSNKQAPLPATLRDYQKEVDRVIGNDPPGTLWIVERNMAIRHDLSACDSFDPKVWMRAKTDFVKVHAPVAVAIDWKTGAIKEEQEQLGLMAQCVFSQYEGVEKIRTQYVWLGHNATTTADFTRDSMQEMWLAITPEIEAYEAAYKAGDFPPRPSGLCKRHCPVQSCMYYGKGSYGG